MTGSVRVLHVAEAFGGGLLEMVRLVAGTSAAEGWPTAIAYGRRPETPVDPTAVVDERVELFALPWDARTIPAQLRAARALRRLVGSWAPDVVHLHSSFAGAVGAAVVRGPKVYTPHGFASRDASRGRAARGAYGIVDGLVCRRATIVGAVSDSEAAVARSLGAKRVEVVANGIPELDAPTQARPARTGGPKVVAVGRLVGQRRPEECARILGAVADVADVEWIGGGGGGRGLDELRAAGVAITGWLPREQALVRLAAADAYLHWTAWDGQPLSVLEAIAAGTPVVASDIPPNRELLGAQDVAATEAEAAAMLRRLVTEPSHSAAVRAGQAARGRRHGARRMGAAWLALYHDLTTGLRNRERPDLDSAGR